MLDQFISDMFEFDDDTVSFFDKTNILEKVSQDAKKIIMQGTGWLIHVSLITYL